MITTLHMCHLLACTHARRLFCGTFNTNGQKSCDISRWLAIDLVPTPPDLFVIGYTRCCQVFKFALYESTRTVERCFAIVVLYESTSNYCRDIALRRFEEMDLRPNAYIMTDSPFEPEWEAQIEKALAELTHKYAELVKKGAPGASSLVALGNNTVLIFVVLYVDCCPLYRMCHAGLSRSRPYSRKPHLALCSQFFPYIFVLSYVFVQLP